MSASASIGLVVAVSNQVDIGFVSMPEDGIHRSGRWRDAELYPRPGPPADMSQPLLDGERWEAAQGQFSTIKFSASAEGAIGRNIARYRRRVIDDRGNGILDAIRNFLSGPPDPGEPQLHEGRIPPDVFEDMYALRVPKRADLRFIDLMSPDTLDGLDKGFGPLLRTMTGLEFPGGNLAQYPDRRVTRLLMTLLHQVYSGTQVVGIRYPGRHDPKWDAFVVWAPPLRVSLTDEDVEFRWVARWDADLVAAAKSLDLRIP